MKNYRLQDFRITLEREGPSKYLKASYPVRYGRLSEIAHSGNTYLFNACGEIKYISGNGPDWPHPAEWLKRTSANDWVYYSTGSYYAGVFDLFGEFYLPCPAYQSNSLFKEKPFARAGIVAALRQYSVFHADILDILKKKAGRSDKDLEAFLARAGRCSADYLRRRADRLHRILQARISVLPPDCRHVDYDVIPVMITDGCLYNCSFCEVKSGVELLCRSRQDIRRQLVALRDFFGRDLPNYNSIYLGQHDALGAPSDDILFAAAEAYRILDVKYSYMQEPRLFLFGSAESFLGKAEEFWRELNRLPFYTYVNLGLESFDEQTLRFLGKPVRSKMMLRAFERMLALNSNYEHIEITANFLLGDALPATHIPALVAHLGHWAEGAAGKGSVYISPLKGSKKTKELLEKFRQIKRESRFNTFLYLIQRL